jgi:nitrate/nitrite-specific signal transduction histidine kinase
LLIGVALTMLLVGFVTWLLRRSVFRPLDGFRRATTPIRRGDEGVRLGWTRRDELGDLARDFDLMAASSRTAMRA